jgi:hypothetical protein
MSDLEKEVLAQEEGSIEEAKASFGDPSEVPEPTTKEVDAPGTEGKDADAEKTAAPKTSPTQVNPKTKIALIKAIGDATSKMKKNELQAAYNAIAGKNEEVEAPAEATSIREIKKVTAEDVNVAEDVEAMFGGEELSEDFTTKATTIFEAAVVAKVNEVLESVTIDLEAELEAEKEEIVESLSTKLDDYMDYVVEQWMEQNELAVTSGIKAEIVENFMVGLRNLFTENYIDIPEEKVDLVDELASKVSELEDGINEEVEKNIEIRKQLAEAQKTIVLRDVTEGLTESQIVKVKSLAEGVDFESAEDYAEKLTTIKENYFPVEVLSEEAEVVDEEPIELDEETEVQVDPSMQAYMDAITRSIKK